LDSVKYQTIANLNPAYFAMVMATGIVSIASHLMGFPIVGLMLLFINVSAFGVLWTLNILRLTMFPQRFWGDLFDHRQGVGFFTSVAATCVLGSQFLLIAELRGVAVSLWIVGIALWFVLTYTIFTNDVTKQTKPPLVEAIHGGWLVSVVATQSVAVLGAMLAAGFGDYREPVLFFALTMWLGGGMLYIWIISIIFYRIAFLPIGAPDMAAPFWINMGAMAISTLAGVTLVAAADGSDMLSELKPFLKGFTLFFWATATWWIPMLITLGIWRHVVKKYRVAYEPQYWSLVFPLGMYTTCTYRLMNVFELPFLYMIPSLFLWIALAAWSITFVGLLGAVIREAWQR
jgi:tellurite resistance protein TehA-like permease